MTNNIITLSKVNKGLTKTETTKTLTSAVDIQSKYKYSSPADISIEDIDALILGVGVVNKLDSDIKEGNATEKAYYKVIMTLPCKYAGVEFTQQSDLEKLLHVNSSTISAIKGWYGSKFFSNCTDKYKEYKALSSSKGYIIATIADYYCKVNKCKIETEDDYETFEQKTGVRPEKAQSKLKDIRTEWRKKAEGDKPKTKKNDNDNVNDNDNNDNNSIVDLENTIETGELRDIVSAILTSQAIDIINNLPTEYNNEVVTQLEKVAELIKNGSAIKE